MADQLWFMTRIQEEDQKKVVLSSSGSWHNGKTPCQESGKVVVCVAQLVAALIMVHGLLSFLLDVHGLFGPAGKTLSPTMQLKRTMSSIGHKRQWSTESQSVLPDGSKRPYMAMNRDEGSYQLSHTYDRFLDTAFSRRVKNRKNWVPASSDEGLW